MSSKKIVEVEPFYSGKVNVNGLKSSNRRETMATHVASLADKMRHEIKDRFHPLRCVTESPKQSSDKA
jgi:hypothetical protein